MRRREYIAFYAAGLGLSLAILAIFQIYISREPARIEADKAADLAEAIQAGAELYTENCGECHGDQGEGILGPPLNSRELLTMTSDDVFFNLTRTGVPGTSMPAWGQAFGGPFTNEDVRQLVAFIRAWEADAPEIVIEERLPDPVRGATLFANTCFICHGEDGKGTDIAPAINDLERLEKLEDDWYREVIANGRPARGMPTWGTVLAPDQIADLVVLIGAWRDGRSISPDIPLIRRITSALYAVRQFDRADAAFHLFAAQAEADEAQAGDIQRALDLVAENQLFEAEGLLISLFPPEEMGRELFTSNCTQCHGEDGTGKTAPNLFDNDFIQSSDDETLLEFILAGKPGTAMDGFEGILLRGEVENLVALLRTWQH
jgi:mono/diheme cytochrome c family protein